MKPENYFNRGVAVGEGKSSRLGTTQRKATAVSPEILAAYAGTYETSTVPADTIIITLQNGQLMFGRPGSQQKTPLSAESETVFYSKTIGTLQVTFVKNSAGTVTGIALRQGASDWTALRK